LLLGAITQSIRSAMGPLHGNSKRSAVPAFPDSGIWTAFDPSAFDFHLTSKTYLIKLDMLICGLGCPSAHPRRRGSALSASVGNGFSGTRWRLGS
jgi:hypothetical protein